MEGKKKFSKKRIVLAVIAGVVVVAGALGLGLKAYQMETTNAKRASAKFVRQVSNDSTKEIEITRNISLSEPLVIDTEKVITGSGLIKASSEWKTVNGDMDYLFVIKEGGSLTVKGSAKMDAKNHTGAIYVDKGTNLSLEEQAEIIGGKENAIYDAGTFTQKGGIVKGSFNNVYVAEGGKFTFSEGENNAADNCGILVAEDAYLNTTTLKVLVQKARTDGIRVEGEAVIDHIRMLENRRNQIHVTKTGKLTLNKGNFEKAKLHGITNSGTMVMNNGVITESKSNGIVNMGTLDIKGGRIFANEEKGVVNRGGGTLVILNESVTITGNNIGVAVEENSTAEIAKAIINSNDVYNFSCFGELYLHDIETGDSGSNCIATNYGGHVVAENMVITSTRTNNGIYNINGSVVELKDVTIKETKSRGIQNKGGTLTGENITIIGCGQGVGAGVDTFGNKNKVELNNLVIKETKGINVALDSEMKGTVKITNADLGFSESNNIRTYGGKLILENVKINGTKGTGTPGTKDYIANTHCILSDKTEIVAKNVQMTNNGGSALRLRAGTKFTGKNITANNINGNGLSAVEADVNIQKFTVKKTGESAIYLEKSGNISLTNVKITGVGKNNVNLAKKFAGTVTLKNAELGKTTTNNIRTYSGKLVLEDVKIYGTSGTVDEKTGKVTLNNHCILADNTTVVAKKLWMTSEGGSGLRLREGTTFTGTDVTAENVAYNGISTQDASVDIKGFTVTKTGQSAIALEKGGNVTLTDVKVTEAGINNVNMAKGFTGTATLIDAELGKTTTNNIRTYGGKLVLEDVKVYGASGTVNKDTGKVTLNNHGVLADNTEVVVKELWMTNEGGSGLRLRAGTKLTGTDVVAEDVAYNGVSTQDASASIKRFTVTKSGSDAIYLEKDGEVTLTGVKVTEAGNSNVTLSEGFTGTATLKNAELGKTTTNNIRTYDGKLVLKDVKVYGAVGTSNHCVLADNTEIEVKGLWMTNEEGASGLRLRKETKLTGTDVVVEDVAYNALSGQNVFVDIKGLTVTKSGYTAIALEEGGNVTLTDVKVTEAGFNNVNLAEGFIGTATLKNAELGKTTTNNIRTFGGKLVLENAKIDGASGTNNHGVLADSTEVQVKDISITNEGGSGLRLKTGTKLTGTNVVVEKAAQNGLSTAYDATADITGFTVKKADGDAISLTETSAVTLTNAEVQETTGYALKTVSGTTADIKERFLIGTAKTAAIEAEGSSNVTAEKVTVEKVSVGGDTFGVQCKGSATVTLDGYTLLDKAATSSVNLASGYTGTTTVKKAVLGETTKNNIRTYGGKLILEDVKIDGTTGDNTSTHCILTDATIVDAKDVWMTNAKGASGLRLRNNTTFTGTDITIENVKTYGISTAITDTAKYKEVDTTITGLTIKGADENAIVYEAKGTHTLENVTIATANEKYGVSINSTGAVVSMINATITGGSKAINNKGNLTLVSGWYQNDIAQNGTLTMGTDAVVGYNANWEKTAGKVILMNENPVQFSGETKHTADKPMTFSMTNPSEEAIVATFKDAATTSELQNRFKMDEDNLSLKVDDKNLLLDTSRNVAKVDNKYYDNLPSAIDAVNANKSGKTTIVTFLKDVEIGSTMTINGDVTIQNKAGSDVTLYRETGLAAAHMFDVKAGGSLTIQGVETYDSLVIDGRTKAEAEANTSIDVADGSTKSMIYNGGTVTLNKVRMQYVKKDLNNGDGGVISNVAGATLNVTGALFDNNFTTRYGSVVYNKGVMKFENTTFTNNKGGGNGGVLCHHGGTSFSIDGCTFTGNSGKDGGVIWSNADFTVDGCTFTENNGSYGGAICTPNDKTINVTIENSKFEENVAINNGGAINFGDQSTATIKSNILFKGNEAKTAGAITVANGGKVSFADCEFKDNKNTGSTYEGDDVRLGGNSCTITIAGKFVGNVNHRNSSKVYILGALTDGSAVELDWYDRRTHPTKPELNYFPLEAIKFVVDAQETENTNEKEIAANKNCIRLGEYTFNQELELKYQGATGTLQAWDPAYVATIGLTPYTSLTEAVRDANEAKEPTIVSVVKNVVVESKMEISGNVTIQNKAGSDITLYRGTGLAAANMFAVKEDGSLTIKKNETSGSLTIDGRTKTEADAGTGIDAAAGSSNSLINNQGTLKLNNITVQYVKCVNGNGAVIYNQGTSFTASGCTFSYNSGKEGGVIWSNKHYTVDGCTFSENRSTLYGTSGGYGGAILNRSTATIKNSTFQSNIADQEGGAISTVATTGLTIENCKFIENSAKQGGAVRTNNTDITITITGCEFNENKATQSDGLGGALVMGSETTVTVTDTKFNGNQAPKAGAVTVTSGGKATFTDCEFTDNTNTSSTYEGDDIRLGGSDSVIKISGKFVGNVNRRGKANVQIVGLLSEGSNVEVDWNKTNVGESFEGAILFVDAQGAANTKDSEISANKQCIRLGTHTSGMKLVDSISKDNALDLVKE